MSVKADRRRTQRSWRLLHRAAGDLLPLRAGPRHTDKATTIRALQQAGDLLLLGNNLDAVVTAIGLSRATLRKNSGLSLDSFLLM